MNNLAGLCFSLHNCGYSQFHNTGSTAGIQFFNDPCDGLVACHRGRIKMAGPPVASLGTGKDQDLSPDIRAELAISVLYYDTRSYN